MLVGPSGCGKTTAMRLVNRMIDLTSGDILIDGKTIKGRSTADLRREIGYVIQNVGLFPHLTIPKNISVVPKLLGWDKQAHGRPVRANCSTSSGCRRRWVRATPASCPAASASVSASPARSPPTRRSC